MNDLFVFHKPVGLPSAPGPENHSSAVDEAIAQVPEIKNVKGLKPGEYGLLHRLDTTTSGLLLFATSQKAFDYYRALFAAKKLEKIYRAVVCVSSADTSLIPAPQKIDWDIGNSAKTKTKVIVITRPELLKQIRGKPYPASTEILSSCEVQSLDGTRQFDLEILIRTGVRHQIRAHLSSVNLPILGDPRYKGAPSSRLWLHASKVVIPSMSSGEKTLESPLPRDWPPGISG